MLASEHEGERSNAAAMIAAMAKKEGKLVADFVGGTRIVYQDRIVYRDRPAHPGRDRTEAFNRHMGEDAGYDFAAAAARARARREAKQRTGGSLLQAMREALKTPDLLSAWEEQFCEDVLATTWIDEDLSSRQMRVAEKIARKLAAYNADPLI